MTITIIILKSSIIVNYYCSKLKIINTKKSSKAYRTTRTLWPKFT